MEPNPTTPPAAEPIPAPRLDYAPPRRFGWLRRWFRPGSVGFFVLILTLAAAGTWGPWKWRLNADEKAFNERAEIDRTYGIITFNRPPNVASLRHLTRLAGTWALRFDWSEPADPAVLRTLRGRGVPWVTHLYIGPNVDVDAWLEELTRPESGLKTLTFLSVYNTKVTDAGLKELARPDSGLKILSVLELRGTKVTNAGIAALQKARPRLEIRH